MTAEIIPFAKADKPEPRCAFCKKEKSKCKSLIAGAVEPVKHICGECLEKATKLAQE